LPVVSSQLSVEDALEWFYRKEAHLLAAVCDRELVGGFSAAVRLGSGTHLADRGVVLVGGVPERLDLTIAFKVGKVALNKAAFLLITISQFCDLIHKAHTCFY
jgi:hypothetical protein